MKSLSSGRKPGPRPSRAAAFAAALVAAVACAASSRALAGDPAPGAPPGEASATSTPRLAALEQEIRHLEKHLSALRKARTELHAGRPEPVAVDDDARRERDARQKALREVQRYEASRAKALGQWSEAVASKDAEKVEQARAALDGVDQAFVAAVAKVDEAAKAPDAKPGDAKAGDTKAGPAKREGSAAGSGEGSKPAGPRAKGRKPAPGGMTEEADGDDEEDCDSDEG